MIAIAEKSPKTNFHFRFDGIVDAFQVINCLKTCIFVIMIIINYDFVKHVIK